MLFSSITFLYFFLPIIILLYFIIPTKFKNIVLLSGSLIFYAWGEKPLVIMLAGTIFLGWLLGLYIGEKCGTKTGKILLTISVGIDLGALFYFKYANFFLDNIRLVFRSNIPYIDIVLPMGISFYTFQIISYTVDVYRGRVPAQKNLINFATYVSLFPQLIAGPIVRYSDIRTQLEKRKSTISGISCGIKRFVIGLSKKVIIANSLGEIVDLYRKTSDASVLYCYLYAIAFMLQIYYDFSGYSDMAIGLGKIFAFEFDENFDYPYMSKSVTEFWRRWHISLGSWFRDYVYIPLGGNRKGQTRQLINIIIVWMLTGFWHGAAWNFIFWGILYAGFLIIEKNGLLTFLEKHDIIGHIYVVFITLIGFVLFNANGIGQAINDIKILMFMSDIKIISYEAIYYLKSYFVIIILAILFATSYPKRILNKLLNQKISLFEPVIITILLLLSTAYLVDGSFNPFLYFRF